MSKPSSVYFRTFGRASFRGEMPCVRRRLPCFRSFSHTMCVCAPPARTETIGADLRDGEITGRLRPRQNGSRREPPPLRCVSARTFPLTGSSSLDRRVRPPSPGQVAWGNREGAGWTVCARHCGAHTLPLMNPSSPHQCYPVCQSGPVPDASLMCVLSDARSLSLVRVPMGWDTVESPPVILSFSSAPPASGWLGPWSFRHACVSRSSRPLW